MSAAAKRYVPSTSSVRYWLRYAAYHASEGELDEGPTDAPVVPVRLRARHGATRLIAWRRTTGSAMSRTPTTSPSAPKCLRAHEPTCLVVGGRAALTTLYRPDGAS